MAKDNSSFSLFLNVVLGVVVVGGGFLAYHYGNFQGVSVEKLEKEYIAKNKLTFDDLPSALKERYIDKEAIMEQSKEADLLEDRYVDEKGNPIPESEVSNKDFRRMITKLQKTLLFLQHDNLLVTNEKNELLKKVEEIENEREEERNSIINKNLEKINEAEQQHYKNISDLTMKINELQKENVIIAQRANLENNALKSHIEELKSKAIEEESRKKQEIFNAREDERSKLSDYRDKIKFLSDQIALLNEQMNTNNETAKNAFNRKMEEINKLKEEIVANNKEKHELLTKNAALLAESERKHNDEIAKYNKSIELIKSQSEQLALKSRQDRAELEEEHQKKIASYEEKLKNLNSELLSGKKHIDALMLENEKDFNKFKTYLEDEKKLNKELIATNKKLEENAQSVEKNLNAIIAQRNEEIVKKESGIKDLENKIIALKNEKQNFDAEVKKKIDENDKIHNKNYKIFNEKIAAFDSSKREMLEKLDKQLGEYKDAAKENYDKMQFHVNELTRTNGELKLKYEEKEKEALALKNQIATLKDESIKGKEAEESKLAQAKNNFDSLKAEVKQKESEYLAKINTLENEIRAKESGAISLQKDVTFKIAALEKELKTKELQIQSSEDLSKRQEETLKSLHVKLKEAEVNATQATNKQVEELKSKLALIEKNRVSEDAKVVSLKDELKRKEIEYLDNIKAIEKENRAKENQLGNNKKEDGVKLAALEKELKAKESALQTVKEELSQKLSLSEQNSKALQDKIKTLEANALKSSQTVATQSATPKTKGQKLSLLDKVSCTDMGTGTNAISSTCKQNVQEFLAKYDDSHLFEVAPIVDNGGFASLKLIKSKKVGVEDTEIDRISGLANIGLGKARAKAGGELISGQLGESAKISYALSNIEMDKARGFEIRVYK